MLIGGIVAAWCVLSILAGLALSRVLRARDGKLPLR